jgi:NAD-dependent dihydropyrimidine dehydrogenase PreA subunit
LRFDEPTLKPCLAYPDDCIWCFLCEIHCPGQCITVTPAPRRIPAPYALQ